MASMQLQVIVLSQNEEAYLTRGEAITQEQQVRKIEESLVLYKHALGVLCSTRKA